MSLKQIVYASQPFGFDEAILSSILIDARRCNKRDGITGALVCRHDIYIQLLEGPEEKVDAAFARIARDDRHVNMIELVSEPVETRMFAEWDMLHDPAQTWLWTEAEIGDDILDRVTPDQVKTLFAALLEKAKQEGAL